MNILTTGTGSGIGRYINEQLGGYGMTRETAEEVMGKARKEGADVIIHCAFNSEKEVDARSLYRYFDDNVMFTERLTSIPHRKFIYFSTVDIYTPGPGDHSEDETIFPEKVKSMYALTKLISESIVREKCTDYLIIRPTTLVGMYSRKNTLLKILDGDSGELYLSGRSRFNYVLYSDVLSFITYAVDSGTSGIYNAASAGNILLSETAELAGRTVCFGSHHYDVGNVSNNKIASLLPIFNKTSKDVINHFIGEYARA